ncbi:MAG: type VI secretion system tip protein VgrG [Polyangiaceae bacterium]|nr:type VI secretion system tip protein VgrG [Polyangiaceae bacterium]
MRERVPLFESAALGGAALEVARLDGTDELGQLFRFRVLLVGRASSLHDGARELLRERATLAFVEEGAVVARVHGIVSEVEESTDVESDLVHLAVTLVPRAWLLGQRHGNQVFLERTVPEILAEKLGAVGLEAGDDFVLHLRGQYPAREIVVQYDETDLAFVSRLAEHLGITLAFEHRDGRDVVVFTDTEDSRPVEGHPTVHVRHRREHPAAFDVATSYRRLPEQALVHDYNYRTPALALTAGLPTGVATPHGEIVECGTHPKTPAETSALARIRAEELAARQEIVTAKTTLLTVHAGRTLTLADARGGERELLLTRVDYAFRTAAASGPDRAGVEGWVNTVTAIPKSVRFRPPRATPKPRVGGLLNAFVDGAIRGPYAELDEAGRYHVRMLYDRSGRTDLGASHPVRMMQPHAGAYYGMHFPLRPGTEVLVGCVDGDPDRPVIVGTAPNPLIPSPVDRRNQTQNVLRTGSNNEMVIEDTIGDERIRIHTPRHDTTIQMGSVEEPEEGVLTRTEAHVSAAARLSCNEATTRKTTIADSATTVLGRAAVLIAGAPAVTAACRRGIDQPAALRLGDVGKDLQRLSLSPEDWASAAEEGAEEPPPAADGDAESAGGGGLWSATASSLSSSADAAALEAVRGAARATDRALGDATGRTQGEPLGDPLEPAALLASTHTAAVLGRDTALVWGDRVAALSSYDSASVVGRNHAELKSPGTVEVAAGVDVLVSAKGDLDMEAHTVRVVGGYYPDAESPPLDEETSVGILARRDLRLKSMEHCIQLCAHKNLIASAHTGDVRITAAGVAAIRSGSVTCGTGDVTVDASGDVSVTAGGDLAVDAAGTVGVSAGGDATIEAGGTITIKGGTVVIEGGSIALRGPVTVEGDLTVCGAINGG